MPSPTVESRNERDDSFKVSRGDLVWTGGSTASCRRSSDPNGSLTIGRIGVREIVRECVRECAEGATELSAAEFERPRRRTKSLMVSSRELDESPSQRMEASPIIDQTEMMLR